MMLHQELFPYGPPALAMLYIFLSGLGAGLSTSRRAWERGSLLEPLKETGWTLASARGADVSNQAKQDAENGRVYTKDPWWKQPYGTLEPAPIMFAYRIMRRLEEVRKAGSFPWLRPDAKCQVTVAYDYAGKPCRISAVVLSTQHSPDVTREALEKR